MTRKIQPYLFLILVIYLALGYFYPAVGLIAIICMIGPVIMAQFKGRYWCGNFCPRGSFYDSVISRLSPRKPIPAFFRAKIFRTVMLAVIMSVFSAQMYFAWGNFNAMGLVFLRIIFITTIFGVLLGLIYRERTWCSFCPMGTMASWFSKNKKPLAITKSCKSCQLCVKVCPMQLDPSTKKSSGEFNHEDCLKCSRCVSKCPLKALNFESDSLKSTKAM